jgi:peroxiredoxin
LRSIQKNLNKFNEAGIRPVAISIDSPEINRDMMLQKTGYTFTFLSDPKVEAIRRYDVVHAGQGENGADVARPAEFLIDSSGTIRWRMLTENLFVRARPEEVLEAAKVLQ